jgi:hypothetical protein
VPALGGLKGKAALDWERSRDALERVLPVRFVLSNLSVCLDSPAQELAYIAVRRARTYRTLGSYPLFQDPRLPLRVILDVARKGENLLNGSVDHQTCFDFCYLNHLLIVFRLL